MRQENSHAPLEISIGSIVALKAHPFFRTEDKEIICISGDADLVPPLMVVVEILIENRTVYDENSGMHILENGWLQCKCLWYSSSSSKFEEAWISSKLLKVITLDISTYDSISFEYGSCVVFKTAPIEISKKKSSLKQTGTLADSKHKSITNFLEFTGPVMQVIGTAKSDCKEPLFDTKTGKTKRYISKKLIKCKFFNPSSEKVSEVLLPVECLSKVEIFGHTHLTDLSKAILSNTYLKTKKDDSIFDKTIIKPISISYRLGRYYLEAKDYLENKIVEIPIIGSEEQFQKSEKAIESLPAFEAKGKLLNIKSINKLSLTKLSSGMFWRIKYKDNTDNVTTRTIYNPDFFYALEPNKEVGKKKVNKRIEYVKASCILRNHEVRYFRIDRIQRIEVLDLAVNEAKRVPVTEPLPDIAPAL